MRKLALALLIGLLASAGSLGAPAQRAAAAGVQAKVVIVVGAVEGITPSYRSDADAAAAEFSKYTTNVVKVYSPNATWANVQAAAQGANVLIYLGHGSGYPNPYVGYLQPNGDNGMGLNAAAAGTDYNKQYYGENYMAQLGLAPNALVILNHLCYASGDSEPGAGRPDLSVVQTRVDGYASGFLRGNARAVIAEGMYDLYPYIDGLFTKHETIEQLWKSYPWAHNNFTAWASTRSSGATSEIDPDLAHPQSDGDPYYRSLVWAPGLTTDSVLGVVVTYAPATYHPMTPARLLDTRYGNGLSVKLSANTPATFQVTGRAGIPSGATAVTGNVTVVNPTFSWAIYLGPEPTPFPTTSTLNFLTGEAKANGVTLALGSGGTLSATYMSAAGNTTDLVFDVTGYYTPDTTGATYHPMAAARLVDSRKGTGLSTRLSANKPATFQVTGRFGIPTTATAVTGNVTVVNATFSWAIYLGPDPNPKPTTSTLNFLKGEAKANGVTVALGSGGTLSATYISYSGNTTDLVFDVTGYFTNDLTGARYVPITPVRLLDTRYHNGLSTRLSANTPATFQVAGRDAIPSNATAVTGNVTVVYPTDSWAIYLGPDPLTSPGSSTLNFLAGDVKANGVTVALGSGGTLSATYISYSGNTTDLIFDATGYYEP